MKTYNKILMKGRTLRRDQRQTNLWHLLDARDKDRAEAARVVFSGTLTEIRKAVQ